MAHSGTAPHAAGDTVRTVCGRRITIGRFRLVGLAHPAERVTIDIDRERYDRDEVWASLTPAEARRLAAGLLAQAAAVEHGDAAASAAPRAVTADGAGGRLEVTPVGGEAYAVAVRSHALMVDQPADAGGEDTACTPTELFVASLASCVAFYAGRYLTRHGTGRDGLRVVAEYTMAADRPARVAAIRIGLSVPESLPAARRPALLAVARHCTVHNTLTEPPDIEIDLV